MLALRILVCYLMLVHVVQGHDGHEALPTRGATVDVLKGQLILSREALEILDVRTEEAKPRAVSEYVLGNATLMSPWQRHAFVSSQLGGRIVALRVQPGETVVANQVLAEVESLDLQKLRLELANAQNDVLLSAKLIKEMEPASLSGAIPAQRLVELKSQQQQHLNAMEIAKLKWRSLQLSVESLEQVLKGEQNPALLRFPIRTSIAGIVTHADLAVGKIVDPKEHLFEVVDLSEVWVKIGILEKDLHRIAKGQSVELRLSAHRGETLHTKVDVLGVLLSPETHLGTAWATLSHRNQGPARLLPGMSGQTRLQLPGVTSRLTVPNSAIIRDGAERYVLVETAATKAGSQYQKQSIYLGRKSGGYTEIRSGRILPGDRVVTQGSHELATFFSKGVLQLSSETQQDIGLKVETVRSRAIPAVSNIEGAIDVPPDRRTVASSQLPGTIRRILVDRSQRVKAGDVIAEIASLELQDMQLDLLRSDLERTLLSATLENLKRAGNAIPQRRIWEIESQHVTAVNRGRSLRERLQTVGLSARQVANITDKREIQDTLPLRAPIDGVIVRFDKVLGQVISADEPLFEIHDLSHVWVQGFVSERDIARIQVGQLVRVRLVSDPQIAEEGTIVRSGEVVNDDARTLSIWIELKNQPPARLQHNQLARITVTTGEHAPTPAAPLSALIQDGTRYYAFVEKSDGRFDRRLVQIGRVDDQNAEIRSGLILGDRIAVQGVAQLQTGFAALK
jgi:cobalt-zinc-cadmium efflux system membrane fusion protein